MRYTTTVAGTKENIVILQKNQFHLYPLDHVEGLEITIHEAITKAPLRTAKKIKKVRILLPQIFYAW